MKTLEDTIAEQTAASTAKKQALHVSPLKADKLLAAVATMASTGPERLIINTVFIDKGLAVATYGRALLAMPYTGTLPDETLILTAKGIKNNERQEEKARWELDENGTVMDAKAKGLNYPNWRQVVPSYFALESHTITDKQEEGIIMMGKTAKDTAHSPHPFAGDVLSIPLKSKRVFFPLLHLARLITAIRKAGVKGPLVIQPTLMSAKGDFQTNPVRITAASAPDMQAVLMPCRPTENHMSLF